MSAPSSTRTETELVSALHRELSRLSRRMRVVTHGGAAPLTAPELGLMSLIDDTVGPVSAGELAQALVIDKSTASRQLATLVERGLIERDDANGAGRTRPLVITAAGERALSATREHLRELVFHRVADWPEGRLEQFVDLLTDYNDPERD